MLDAYSEIERLRQSLRFKGYNSQLIDSICNDASIDISKATSDIVADAMNEAVNLGGDVMSVDFIDDLRAMRAGSSFDIVTDSGKTDYSEPPFPMLPSLLKNAKIAQDGSLYKVIPIESKSKNNLRDEAVSITVDAAYKSINQSRQVAKAEKDAEKNNKSTATKIDPMSGPTTFAAMQNLNKARTTNVQVKNKKKQGGSVIDFRTASSKQDPTKSWVHPGRKVDLRSPLNNINTKMQESIDDVIRNVIRQYEDMY